jgi:endonuclease/exonuclease/phosphatase family metal-dependent hydrolase
MSGPKDARTLRFVTLNLWGDNGPHERRLALVELGLRKLAPDIVALQEVREIPGRLANQAETLAGALSGDFAFAPSAHWGGGSGGLAIVSKFPIRRFVSVALPHSTAEETRIVLSALVAGPAGDLWVHTTHLSYRMDEGVAREAQVQFVEGEVAARVEPAAREQPQVLLGDFNAVPDSDEIRWLAGLTTLGGRRVFYQDAWNAVHSVPVASSPVATSAAGAAAVAGWTWARHNPYRARMNWLAADRRIDYIFVTPERRDGRGKIHTAEVVLSEPDDGGVYPSDHAGVMADVQVLADGDVPS